MKISNECIECGLCTKNCDFLKKYGLNLKDFEEREDLAYNCFMCGKCKIVCPKDIDGREIALKLRKKDVSENGGKLPHKGYTGLLLEKKDYIFRNYKNVSENKGGKTVLFTGCNFLSYMPDTANKLLEIFKKKNIEPVFDCCGKPIYELGLTSESEKIIENLNRRLKENNIEELVLVCPNCYYYLEGRLDVKMTDIFSKMKELDIGNSIDRDVLMFRPCPDRESQRLLDSIKLFINGDIELLNEQCCGAGGCASVREKDISKGFRTDIKEQTAGRKLSTYCSTCTGFFRSEGIDTVNVLSEILGVEESGSGNSLINRMKYRFYKNR